LLCLQFDFCYSYPRVVFMVKISLEADLEPGHELKRVYTFSTFARITVAKSQEIY